VTILGAHFVGVTEVKFAGTLASSFTVDSDSQIRASVPVGATTGPISVTNAVGQTASANSFTVGTVSTQTLTFQPTDDSFVRSTAPTKNYARDDELRVRLSSTDYNSYLKFNVTGVTGPIHRATVVLLVIDESPDGGSIFSVSNNLKDTTIPWAEEFLVYNNAPELGSSALSATGPVALNEIVEFDVTSAITGNGIFSFALSSENSNTAKYSSRGGPQPPELVIIAATGTSTPVINSFSPAVGPIGTEVTIVGSEFTGASQVTFNGTPAASFTVQSDERVLATVPIGATNGKIRVVTGSGTASSTNDFVVFAPPVIDSFVPTIGPVGTQVTISGSNFSGVTSVSFNGTAATNFTFVTENAETKIRATVPAGATTGKISLTNAAGSGTSVDDFTIGNSPVITSFDPTLGVPGTEVTIIGLNFTGTTAVSFNGSPAASFSIDSDTQLRGTVPSLATTGPITITNGSGTSSDSEDFTVVFPPTISGFSPNSGPIGTEVTLTGHGFLGTTDVAFNGTSAISFIVNSASEIRVTVPAGATTGSLSLTNPAGSTLSTTDFTVTSVGEGGTFTFNPSDDAFVRSTRPDKNYDNDDELRVRKSSTDYDSYLKFTVSGLSVPVVSALMRLHVIDDGDQGGEIYSVSNNLRGSATPWSEATLTFNTAPEISGAPLDQKSSVALGATVDFDVTAAIAGDGTYSFAISNDHSNTVKYSSQEGVSIPELIITTGLTKISDQTRNLQEKNINISTDQPLPTKPTLYPNFPNPFNLETTITYALPNTAKVKLRIYNLKGQLVRVLFDGEQERGFQRILWNGRNRSGVEVSSGVYFVRLEAGELRLSRKITLQK
ncbi:DNRLRE domain-containing protein, partial [bacterium]|nr:DNRLRE domain-containing protein [bacterium]